MDVFQMSSACDYMQHSVSKVRVCDTCGDLGREYLLASCKKCTDGAQHTYCMCVQLNKVPKSWTCEECMPREGAGSSMQDTVQKVARRMKGRLLEKQINHESIKGSKKIRSPNDRKSRTNDVSSTSRSKLKRHGDPLKDQEMKKTRAVEKSFVAPSSSKPCNNSLIVLALPCQVKTKSIKSIVCSSPQKFCDYQDKEKVPHACGDREHVKSLPRLGKSGWARKTSDISPEASNSQNYSTLSRKKSPESSNSCNHSTLGRKPPSKKFGELKLEETKSVTPPKLTSYVVVKEEGLPYCDYQDKGKSSHACGDREHLRSLAKLGKNGKARATSDLSPEASNSHNHSTLSSKKSFKASNSPNHSTLGKKPPSKKLRKVKLEAAGSVSPPKLSSYGIVKKEVLPYCFGNGSLNLGSQTKIARDKCSQLKSSSSKAANLKTKEKSAKAGCLQKQKDGSNQVFHDNRKGKGKIGNETISSGDGDTLFSGSSFRNFDVDSSAKLDHRLQASNFDTHKDTDYLNEKKRKESRQAEDPTEATTAIMEGHAFDEWSRLRDLALIEATILSQSHLIPEFHYSWLGKFQIHSSEGIARTCDGFQAHLSTCPSVKVLEVVYKLPEIIILEELPRLRIWPSQFMGAQVTMENIDLHFFAKDVNSYNTYYSGLMTYMTKHDLALKGNLDGAELLIFPSNILPKEIQRWNDLLFFWGVFKERKANNSTNSNTPISNALMSENGDTKKYQAFDLNAYPENEDEEAGVAEIPEDDNKGGTTNAKHSENRDTKKFRGIDLNAYPEDVDEETGVVETPLYDSKGCTRSAKHVSGAIGIEDNVTEPSTLHSIVPEKVEDFPDWEIAETLILLSRKMI
ncbi:ASI1-immunoprecipitated protein 2 isoform X3 [Cicer arietinum]|uniref:Uncharacterized protein LOC101505946 isoform X1 n=2 Tax=Cicer arietinum TaxID=3827 RepID=A0A1S2YY46_CICAR|nr:uncharacterized protein LOC101505946 isoform X1 [Cicer arietinum]XP_027193212.1 uncharacterized protein LOC101505946 isoform X1 [Cicer arietinum]